MSKTQFTQPKQTISPKLLLRALIALIVMFILLNSVVSLAQKYIGIRRHIDDLDQEKGVLEQKYKDLERTNEYLSTDAGAEYALREKYNVVKPGEGVVVVVEPLRVAEPERPSRVSRWWQAIVKGLGWGKE
jgi:cell division protein FtsB